MFEDSVQAKRRRTDSDEIHPGDMTLSVPSKADSTKGNSLSPFRYRSTLRKAGIYAGISAVYALLPITKEFSQYHKLGDQPANLHAVFALILGALLVFRTNAAYARWWEARTLWGRLNNDSRGLAAKINAFGTLSSQDRESARSLLIQFPQVLTKHLRQKLPRERATTHSRDSSGEENKVDQMFPDLESVAHAPVEIAERLYILMGKWKKAGKIDGDELRIFETDATGLLNVCGGSERIRNTPFVGTYRVFARQCIGLSLLTFPWGIVNEFHWWTIPLTAISTYFMLGLELVAEQIEDPFGVDENDLDLDGMSNSIKNTVNQIFDRRAALEQLPN
ncbi:bestrophin family protein [Planctomicrobium sp. SH527]|uniref:bestrophin family protein n=1 Tax=Planctomicrobium sp. SH527 TaxID=3448123 RepID=UPI003F5C53E9